MTPPPSLKAAQDILATLDILVVAPTYGVILTPDGEIEDYSLLELSKIVKKRSFLVCSAPIISRRLQTPLYKAYDILELFAFILPANFCLPLPEGIAEALAVRKSCGSAEDQALALMSCAQKLLEILSSPDYLYAEGAHATAQKMSAHWNWSEIILSCLNPARKSKSDYQVWTHLADWEEDAPRPPIGTLPVSPEEAEERLVEMLGPYAEKRLPQKEYTRLAAASFEPREHEDEPRLVLAEAGTGIGKTLGYIAPASLWAEKNGGTVWISTYTKNLQRQLDQELDRLYPDKKIKQNKVVIRKGRENYLCLLNLQEISSSPVQPKGAVFLGLVSRWARFSRDGDMVGGDFPAWLGDNFGIGRISQLTDKRGECIYSACAHYKKCFIEKNTRKAKKADLVIANHALVMMQAAVKAGNADLPMRYVFDEGHHIFDAADNAFSAHITGMEAAEMRRWIRGAERSGRRGKGLKGRIEDLLAADEEAVKMMDEIIHYAVCLPSDIWHSRIIDNRPVGPAENFLMLVRHQTISRSKPYETFHTVETSAVNPSKDLVRAATELYSAVVKIAAPMIKLSAHLIKQLNERADELDSNVRGRMDNISRSLKRRADVLNEGWLPMLNEIIMLPDQKENLTELSNFATWFEVERIGGKERDYGMHRHFIDPSLPFSEYILKASHGALITSATLRDKLGEESSAEIEWNSAEIRTGAAHMIAPPRRMSFTSPFNYKGQAKIFIITDINKQDIGQLASAYREFFLCSDGSGLGLFTAISRLKAVYERIITPLEDNHIPLYAQHIDPINTGTLVDIFRSLKSSCLLGTDAVRDGVDVPGESLKICIFDRVPWPRPTLLHKARRERFGKKSYDDLITRLKLKQAFGRLIRREKDRGVFIMLDGALPTRLLSAFPPETEIQRIGLAEALQKTRDFLDSSKNP